MKRKRQGNGPEKYPFEAFAERQHWKWQWLRRNEEYRKDFNKYGKGLQRALKKYNDNVRAQIKRGYDPPHSFVLPHPYDVIYHQMRIKWGVSEGLRDPDDPSAESLRLSVYKPFVYTRFSNDWRGGKRIFLEDRRTWFKPDGGPDWVITDESEEKSEPLIPENCPHYLIVTARVDPWTQKTSLLEAINRVIDKELNNILEAQRSVLKQNSMRPRFNQFETYIKIYDRIKQNRGKLNWTQIALEFFPNDVDRKSAINKVKQDYQQAQWWIDEGWQLL